MATQVFLSCSFRDEDGDVASIVRSICEGSGLACINVSTASGHVPPDEARRLIGKSAGVVAIATRRDASADGTWYMPSSVHDEISIAYGMRTPILILREEDVRLDGFITNYGTYLTFSRARLRDAETIGKLVSAISGFKEDITGGQVPIVAMQRGFHSEETKRLVVLEESENGFTWRTLTSKRIRFDQPFASDLKSRWWCGHNEAWAEASDPPMHWELSVDGGSTIFTPFVAARFHTADMIDLSIKFKPQPQPGDYVEYSLLLRSAYLNPIFPHPGQKTSVTIEGRGYDATDGFIPIEQTRVLKSSYRFPRSYGLVLSEVRPFVASYSFDINYLSESELARAKVSMESFGGDLLLNMEIDNPLSGHKYGFAWCMPTRK